MQIEMMDITQIKLVEYNPESRITILNLLSLKDKIQKHGIISPLLVDKDNYLADGNRRYFCAKALGFNTVPVIKHNTLTKEEIYSMNADHKQHQGKEWYEAVVRGLDLFHVPLTQRRYIEKLRDVLRYRDWIRLGFEGTAPSIYSQAVRLGKYTERTDKEYIGKHVLWIKDHRMSNDIRKAMEIILVAPNIIRQHIDENKKLVSSEHR